MATDDEREIPISLNGWTLPINDEPIDWPLTIVGEPVELTVHFDNCECEACIRFRAEREACTALPCEVCGGCWVCKDFHFYAGRGCTDDTCPVHVRRN